MFKCIVSPLGYWRNKVDYPSSPRGVDKYVIAMTLRTQLVCTCDNIIGSMYVRNNITFLTVDYLESFITQQP